MLSQKNLPPLTFCHRRCRVTLFDIYAYHMMPRARSRAVSALGRARLPVTGPSPLCLCLEESEVNQRRWFAPLSTMAVLYLVADVCVHPRYLYCPCVPWTAHHTKTCALSSLSVLSRVGRFYDNG